MQILKSSFCQKGKETTVATFDINLPGLLRLLSDIMDVAT